jgi:hypothetical protein
VDLLPDFRHFNCHRLPLFVFIRYCALRPPSIVSLIT